METVEKLTVKMVMANGNCIALYATPDVVDQIIAHPKFVKMRDNGNVIFVSIDDVAAFEITDFRQQPPKVEDATLPVADLANQTLQA